MKIELPEPLLPSELPWWIDIFQTLIERTRITNTCTKILTNPFSWSLFHTAITAHQKKKKSITRNPHTENNEKDRNFTSLRVRRTSPKEAENETGPQNRNCRGWVDEYVIYAWMCIYGYFIHTCSWK